MVAIHVLGKPTLLVDGLSLALGTPKQQAVLSLLAVNANRTLGIDEFVDELWTGSPPVSAVANVRSYAGNLRRALESAQQPVLIREAGGYRLRLPDDALDLVVFQRLVEQARRAWAAADLDSVDARLSQAEALWRGPMLTGVPLGPILTARCAAADEERLAARELWAHAHLRQGRTRSAVLRLRDHVRAHPLREQAHALLIRALHQEGDPAGAIAAFRSARTILAEQLAIEPGPDLQQLYRAVLNRERLPDPAGLDPAEPGRPTRLVRADERPVDVPVPLNWLPRPVSNFVGRGELVDRMVIEIEAATSTTSPVRVVDGMPGSGKTALVVHLAYRLSKRYPDAQLFIDLRGHAEGAPVEPAAALVALLRQLGVPAGRIPSESAHRIDLWRREIAARRAVVVLDNAADTEQILPLLPTAPGSVVLVTSRRRLSALETGPAESLPLLTGEEAVRLLALTAGVERVGREPEAAAEVARRCGHLPLAIRLAGARLAQRRSWRVAELAYRLGEGTTVIAHLAAEQQTVARAFAASYEPLSEPTRRLFRLLSVHPGGQFDVPMAAALAGLSWDRAGAALDELLDQHLVEELTDGRYRLHDLIRQYSVELSAPEPHLEERQSAAVSLLDHTLHVGIRVAELFEPQLVRLHADLAEPLRPDLIEASGNPDVEWLEQERANLVSLIAFAAENGHCGYAWRLARILWRFCYIRGYFDDILLTHRHGLAAAEKEGDQRAEAMMHNYLASAYTRTASYPKVLRHLESAVRISLSRGDRADEHRYRANLVVVYWLMGDLGQAIALGRQLQRDSAHEIRVSLPNLGIALTAAGQYDEALRAHRLHLFIARARSSYFDTMNALSHIGAVQNRLGRYPEAIRRLTASLGLRDRTGHRFAEAETRNDLGIAYRSLGQLNQARDQHEYALELAVDCGERHVQAAVLNDLGLTLARTGENESAVAAHHRALELATRIAHPYEQGRALTALADHLATGDPAEARRYRQRALVIFERMGAPERYEVASWLAVTTPSAPGPPPVA
ncbi:BTAD domain-containing putative transcriptional regulator [Micromonospora sp. CPCC 205711]|uniref:AfsR/SARP family transcriptional regulator n=1 Tax=Micromonospora sp. CPCC 205547 TaxID=3122400 RepID=UPI002FF1BBF1